MWRGASSSGALGCIVLAGALFGCGGSAVDELFEPNSAGGAGTRDAAAPGTGGAGTLGASAATTSAGTTSAGSAGSSSGSGPATTGGGAGGASGGAGGAPEVDAGPPVVEASTDPPDAARDAARRDGCVPTGREVCNGLDDNCNGGVDEQGACVNGCIGAAHNGRGYMLCAGLNQLKNFNDADNDCTSKGMALVRVDDADVDAFLRRMAIGVNYRGTMWLGGSDTARSGTWVWADGTEFWTGFARGAAVGGHYANWDINQPGNPGGNEDCVSKFGNDRWHGDLCSTRTAYVCQTP